MANLLNTTVSTNSSARLPAGTTSQRPVSPSNGSLRYNTTFKTVEHYDGTLWRYSPDIVREGLVLNLDAAEPQSYSGTGTTWFDLSGNGDNGTLINGPTYSNNNGGSIDFDGVNDRGTFTSPISAASAQTYEIWTNGIAPGSAAGGFAYLLHNNNADDTTGNSYMNIGIRPTQEYFAAFNGAYGTMGSGVTASNSNVVQIILVWDGLTQRVYVNGQVKNSQALTITPQNFSTTTSFGDDKSNTYRMIQGSIYSIKIYNRDLTQEEIAQNFNAQRARFGI